MSFERWLTGPRLSTDWRTSFMIRTWAFGVSLGLCFGLIAAAQRLWLLVAVLGAVVISGVCCLTLLRLTGRYRMVVHLSLAMAAPLLAGAGLLQNPPNQMTPVFLVLLPIQAGFLLSARERWIWLAIAIGLGGTAEWMMVSGHHLMGPLRPHAGLVTAANLAALMLLIVFSVRWFDGMRRDAVERLEAASRARTIFLANVSHEIRTPMNGVLGLTELALAGELSDEQRARMELVQRSGKTLITLIDDLLLISRAESGRLVLSPGPIELSKVVGDVVELFAHPARAKGLTLVATVASTVPPRAVLDGVRWRQVMSNLLGNAVKFSSRGRIEVRLNVVQERLLLVVQDQGPGISPEVLPRLFRPFEQADDSTTRRYGGWGLGLALSRQLSETMGGHLTVASTPGAGSTFTVDLPLVITCAEPAPEVPSPPTLRSARRVLVVDDNPINLLVARGLVEQAGYQVEVAQNGLEAVAAVAREEFALVLMDCQMPELDGLDATRQIRASAHSATPIVALTASGLPEELAQCRAAGMDDCLVKPISLAMIQRALTLAR